MSGVNCRVTWLNTICKIICVMYCLCVFDNIMYTFRVKSRCKYYIKYTYSILIKVWSPKLLDCLHFRSWLFITSCLHKLFWYVIEFFLTWIVPGEFQFIADCSLWVFLPILTYILTIGTLVIVLPDYYNSYYINFWSGCEKLNNSYCFFDVECKFKIA